MDSAGNFFGTCIYGGDGGGWVYELTNCSESCTVIDLHDFTYNGREGATPWGGPTLDANGKVPAQPRSEVQGTAMATLQACGVGDGGLWCSA